MINPIMGIKNTSNESVSLADALFPKVRQRVLSVLFGTPDSSFYANQVIALEQSGTGAVQRELADVLPAYPPDDKPLNASEVKALRKDAKAHMLKGKTLTKSTLFK